MSRPLVLIYASQTSGRLAYIAEVLFNDKAGITHSMDELAAFDGIRISYSDAQPGVHTIWIRPHTLLFEKGIQTQNINCFVYAGNKAFFETGGQWPFDLFAASFYLLSRYEEYLPHEPDPYGRYAHTNSLAYLEDFLRVPLVNEWLLLLQQEVAKQFPDSPFPTQQSKFTFVPTYDIDIAYQYLHQPMVKNILGFYRDLLVGRFTEVVERGNVYSGRKPDPFDTFEWLEGLHKKFGLAPIYFFLTIIKRGPYDKNLPASSKALQHLFERLSSSNQFGLHPSWQSGTEEELLQKELALLQKITNRPVLISRNHYLRFTVPHTYRRLITAGIQADYSMAYGTVNGFRASYALPYQWYDLEKEITTSLMLHPFCFMEASSFFEQGYSAEQAGEEIQYYHDTVKQVKGEFITLFHNHFLTEQPAWIAWREMYAQFLEKNFSV